MENKVLHSIGVKVLSPDMMKCNFKFTESVLQTISNFRSIADRDHNAFVAQLQKDPSDGIMAARRYNNAVSILGSRGSGKTSIIMTLQYILKYGVEAWHNGKTVDYPEVRENIMMPILVPQDFVRGQELLSWVIVQLLEKAEEVEKELNRHGCILMEKRGPFCRWINEKTEKQFRDPLRETMDKLKSAYELRYKIVKQSNNQDTHVFQYMDEVKRDANLVYGILKLISMMTDYYRYVSSKEPLIFFVIDDMDMAPDRSQEVLNLVLRYLQHPNIVVICGWNQELFQTHLTMEVLRTQGITDSGMINVNGDYVDVFMTRQRKKVSLLDSARRLAMDNLKKAFPPSFRYEVRGFDTAQRACFPRSEFTEYDSKKQRVGLSGEEKEEDGSLIDLIEKTLLASRYTREEMDAAQKLTVDFLRTPQNQFMNVYMRIFDNKCRGLINMYLAFENLKVFFDSWDRKSPLDATSVIQSLLDTILFSNTHFFPYKHGIRDLIEIDRLILCPRESKQITECVYYCNYQQVIPILQTYREKAKQAVNDKEYYTDDEYKVESDYNYFPSLIIDVFILLNFMENLFRYVCNLPLFEHGGFAFSVALNDVIPPVHIKENYDSLLSYVILLANIREIPLFPDSDDFRTNLRLLDAYEKEQFKDGQYDFSGSYSYCKLSNAIFTLFSKKDENTGDQVIDRARFSAELKNSPWMRTMYNLFLAMKHNKTNVVRLSRYRCLSRQKILDDDEMIRIACRDQSDSAPEYQYKNIKKNGIYKYIIKETDDQHLDMLVFSLRELEMLNSMVLTTKELEGVPSDEQWSEIKNDPELSERYVTARKLTEQLISIIASANKTLDDYLNKNENIESVYSQLRNFRITDSDTIEDNEAYDDKLPEECADVIREWRNSLLHAIYIRLCAVFVYCYEMKKHTVDKYTYLLQASSAIALYMERWQLTQHRWSEKEQNAVDRLIDLLEYEDSEEVFLYAEQIAQNGPVNMEYETSLQKLEQWVRNRYHDKLSSGRAKELLSALNILRKSGKGAMGSFDIDKEIKNILAGMGRMIADQSANYALSEELGEDRASSERDRIAWPVPIRNRKYFAVWTENLEYSRDDDKMNHSLLFG